MPAIEKLKLCSKSTSGGQRDHNDDGSGILFGAFFIFSVASVMFVSYVAVDHMMERKKLQNQIDEMEEQLEKVRRHYHWQNGDQELQKEIGALVEESRKCDPTHASIELLGKVLKNKNQDRNENFKMWDELPKAFLHVEGKDLSLETDSENVDQLPTIFGWKIEAGGACSDVDPKLNGSDIVIPRDGNYSVYSKLPFHARAGDDPTIHRHIVQYIEVFGTLRDDPKILMESAYQISGTTTKISYQGGVYRFNKGDILRVLVQKAPQTSFYEEDSEIASFGVYSL